MTEALSGPAFSNFRFSSRLVPRAVISASDIPAGTILQRRRRPSELQRTIS
jgi:hypothetical protein